MTQRRPLIVQQEKIARIGRVGHIDRIVDGRRLCQRVITQPRPNCDTDLSSNLCGLNPFFGLP
jgi:hypothetical protein